MNLNISTNMGIPTLTKYIRSCSLLCVPDIDGRRMKNVLHRIFLSSDPDNEDLKVLAYDCLYIPCKNRVGASVVSFRLISGDGLQDMLLSKQHKI
jgi:hypothetical protein